MHINAKLLKNQDCSWNNVGHWSDGDVHIPPALTGAMQNTLAELNSHTPWVMKDPRLCITLPCWLPHLSHPVAVIASRHPLECANRWNYAIISPSPRASFVGISHRRNITPCSRATQGFSHYDDLLASPTAETMRLCDELTEHIPTLCLPDKQEISDFITPSLKRAKASVKEELSPIIRSYTICCVAPFHGTKT